MFTKTFALDLTERAVRTIIAVIGGLSGAATGDAPLPGGESGEVGIYTALITILFALAGRLRGNTDSASLLPGAVMVDDQRFRWVDFPETFEVINPDGSIAWSASFAEGVYEIEDDEDQEEVDE